MKNSNIALLGLLLIVLCAQPAMAFTKGACKSDIKKYCKDVQPGNDRIKTCLKQHVDQLSDACKANIVDVVVKQKEKKAQGQ